MSQLLHFITLISLLFSSIISSTKIEARIKLNWEIVYQNFDPNENYVAKAFYTDSLLEVGWDKLSISTNDIYKDEIQAEGAGRLEGALTKNRIYDFYQNLKSEADVDEQIYEQISKFLEDQERFVIDSVENGEGNRDPMLYNAYLIKKQYNAMMDQYNIVADADKKLEKINFHLMNYYPELFDLIQKFKVEIEGETDYKKMDNKELLRIFLERNHCSALFKLKNDFSELYFGHNTWNSYFSTIRIIKEYNFNFNNRWVRSKNIIFTSYPATLSSIDDFYVSSHGLITIETTNSFYNDTLYSEISPDSLFTCERSMICNRISNSSKEYA